MRRRVDLNFSVREIGRAAIVRSDWRHEMGMASFKDREVQRMLQCRPSYNMHLHSHKPPENSNRALLASAK